MKTVVHRASDRGYANHGWLQAHHSFSFANYFDKDKMHFGALRVLNDDIIAPNMGFGTHPHDNMEIITIPLSGVLKHRDNLKDDWQQVLPGEVQVMSAGTGVQHSEINGSQDEALSLFQIWIVPYRTNVQPRYGQKRFQEAERKNKLQVLVSSMDGDHEGSLKIHQDAIISRIDMDAGTSLQYSLKSKKHGVYMLTVSGRTTVEKHVSEKRDAVGISDTDAFTVTSNIASSILFMEVPML